MTQTTIDSDKFAEALGYLIRQEQKHSHILACLIQKAEVPEDEWKSWVKEAELNLDRERLNQIYGDNK